MSVRISAGSLKHRVLETPRGQTTRPTSAKVREAVFSILGSVEGLRVLDLYAGTGALGIEALSRGAESALFVERDPSAAQCIRGNLKTLGLENSTRLLQLTVDAALRRLGQPPGRLPPRSSQAGQRPIQEPEPDQLQGPQSKFDLVFADPPWAESARARASLAALSKLLSPPARLVYEHARSEQPVIHGLTSYDHRTWGDTGVTFFTPTPG